MPNRILKETICESETLSECSIFARDLYTRIITYADDYGRFNADTQIMLARLYPREMDCVTQGDICDALIELSGVGKIAFYTSSARKNIYGCFPHWKEHQRIRDSKKKCPDPDDTSINDWYLQRFVSIDMRIEIIERDAFKCQICGKSITSEKDARRLIKRGDGMYHIDHIVSVLQGGRATMENLRLTCPTCNLKRNKTFSFKEIVEFSCGNSPQVAASSCELPPNPIQSESNPNPIQSPDLQSGNVFSLNDCFDKTYAIYPRHQGKAKGKQHYMEYLKGRTITGQGKVKFNHQQIYIAVQEYASEVLGKDIQYVKLFDVFMNTHVIDYVEKTREPYEKIMREKYGEDWKEVKFTYH